MKTITLAARAKGPFALLKRARHLTSRYGLTPQKMDQALTLFSQILERFNAGASFALTAIVLKRNAPIITKYLNQNIEFLVHGYTHIDYSTIEDERRTADIRRSCETFIAHGINPNGFRSPYLRRHPELNAAIKTACFSYISNQPILWEVFDTNNLTAAAYVDYKRAVDFYDPWLASAYPSLPLIYDDNLIEIPVSLPDDEILIDRLGGQPDSLVSDVWNFILSETYRRGELFTIQLHPERIAWCKDGLAAVLARAQTLSPAVWLARLDEIAAWWQSRAAAEFDIEKIDDTTLQLSVNGPAGTTILARGVEILEPTHFWGDKYYQVKGNNCHIRTTGLPFIGISTNSSPDMVNFLRQQGYLLEISNESHLYSIYLEHPVFTPQDKYPLLTYIEENAESLVRLTRWPLGARSALCITGDIDALTIGDYGLRIFGK